MARRSVLLIAVNLALAAMLVVLLVIHQREKIVTRKYQLPAMSTWAALVFHGADDRCEAARAVAAREFAAVTRIANVFDPESELSRLNLAQPTPEAPFQCSPELAEILALADDAWRASGGAFDITVKPLMELWGFHRAADGVPDAGAIAACLETVGWGKCVRFDRETGQIAFLRPGVKLDLGGIAKGWAVDRACDAIQSETGMDSGLVNLGGNIRVLPQPPPGREAHRVGITDPADPAAIAGEFDLASGATASSGDYRRGIDIDGVRYSHIIDPQTGYPAGLAGDTVIAPDAATADWLSTALCVNPELEPPEGCAAVLFDHNRRWRLIVSGSSIGFSKLSMDGVSTAR